MEHVTPDQANVTHCGSHDVTFPCYLYMANKVLTPRQFTCEAGCNTSGPSSE